jgi:NADH dehydrogenase
MKRLTVLVLGEGFAGLSAARRLPQRPLDVVLLDATNHYLFQPLLLRQHRIDYSDSSPEAN